MNVLSAVNTGCQ